MIELPTCRWRENRSEGKYLCYSPKFVIPPNHVQSKFCQTCTYVDHALPRFRIPSLPSCQRVLLSFGFASHAELLTIAIPTYKKYTQEYGYDLFIPDETWFSQNVSSVFPSYRDRPYPWYKLPLLLYKVEEGYQELLWLDADVVVTGASKDIFFDVPEEYDMAMVPQCGGNRLGVPSAGVWLLRNRPVVQDLLHIAWQQHDLIRHSWWEQAAIFRLLKIDNHGPPIQEISTRGCKVYLGLD